MHTLPYENCALNLEFMEMKTKEAYLSSNMVFCFSVLFAWLSYRYMRYSENQYLGNIILYQCLLSKIHSDYDIFDEDSFDVTKPVELIADYVKNNCDNSSDTDSDESSSSGSESGSDESSSSGSESDSDSDDNKPLNLLRRSNRHMVLRSDTKKSKIKTQYDSNGIEHNAEHGIDYAFDRDYRYTNARVFGDRDGDSDNDMDMDTTKSLGIKGTNWKLE